MSSQVLDTLQTVLLSAARLAAAPCSHAVKARYKTQQRNVMSHNFYFRLVQDIKVVPPGSLPSPLQCPVSSLTAGICALVTALHIDVIHPTMSLLPLLQQAKPRKPRASTLGSHARHPSLCDTQLFCCFISLSLKSYRDNMSCMEACHQNGETRLSEVWLFRFRMMLITE